MSQFQQSLDEEQDAFLARWGRALDEGYVVIPRALLTRQSTLGLDERELIVFINLVASWWKEGGDPYPSVRTIADRMGVSPRTVQRALAKLEDAGFITRTRNASGNGRASELKVTRYALAGAVPLIEAACLRPLPTQEKEMAVVSAKLAESRERLKEVFSLPF